MTEPTMFPADRMEPVPVGVSIRFGLSEDAGAACWLVWHNDGAGNVFEVAAAPTREEAKRLADAWPQPQAATEATVDVANDRPLTVMVRTIPSPEGPRTITVPVEMATPSQASVRSVVVRHVEESPRTIRVPVTMVEPEA